MIRRFSLRWPDARPFRRRDGRPIRILAVSDEVDSALTRPENHAALSPVDMIVGAGDLEPDYLASVGDAFKVPLHFVRGNHDRGLGWLAHSTLLPEPLPDGGVEACNGLELAGLPWPAQADAPAQRDDLRAWRQALGIALPRLLRRRGPLIVVSHVPPAGAGDDPADPYHAGFSAYRWLADKVHPPLWLHGHTTTAVAESWRCKIGATTYLNVTGAVLVELRPPSDELRTAA